MLLVKVAMLLLTCQQFTVSVAPPVPKFTVSVVAPEPVVAPVTVPAKSGYYLAMFTAPWCGHCGPWKTTEMPKIQSAGLTVTLVDSDNNPSSAVTSLPTFFLYDRSTGKAVAMWEGYVDAATILAGISQKFPDFQSVTKTVPVVQRQQVSETPSQYAVWQGVTYDFEKFSTCSRGGCRMCQNLRPKEQAYWAWKTQQAGYQQTSFVPDHQQPTPADMIDRMLDLMRLTSSDIHCDEGCGDGRILIEAVRQSGCRGIGVEIDPLKAEEARTRVQIAGLSDRIEIITGDALEFDPAEHGVTAITAYLYPELLAKLAPKFKQDCIRVVASPFHAVPGLDMTQHGDVFVYRRP